MQQYGLIATLVDDRKVSKSGKVGKGSAVYAEEGQRNQVFVHDVKIATTTRILTNNEQNEKRQEQLKRKQESRAHTRSLPLSSICDLHTKDCQVHHG